MAKDRLKFRTLGEAWSMAKIRCKAHRQPGAFDCEAEMARTNSCAVWLSLRRLRRNKMFAASSSGPSISCRIVAALALGVSGPADNHQAGSVLIHAFGVLFDPLPLVNLSVALRASCASYTLNLGWVAVRPKTDHLRLASIPFLPAFSALRVAGASIPGFSL